MKALRPGLFLCTLVLATGMALPAALCAQTFTPSTNKKYRCTLKNGDIQIKHKKFKDGKRLPGGKKSYNYVKIANKLNSLEGASTKKKQKLQQKLAAVLEVLLSCFDDQNIERPDGSSPGGGSGGGSGGTGFSQVASILQANCMSCHAARGWQLTESYFLSNDLVVPGDHTESLLYRNLRNNPEGLQPGTMPQSGAGLSQSDIQTIRDWINSIESGSGDTHFACTPGLELAPSQMNRLSRDQLMNSLLDLFEGPLGNLDTAMYYVRWSAYGHWEALPADVHDLGHKRLDDRIDESYLEIVFDIILNLATRLDNDNRLPQIVNAFVPACDGANMNSVTCREEFIRQFGRRVLVGPLSSDDFNFYRQPNSNGVTQASYPQILISLLNSPKFLYHIEEQGTPVDSSGLLLQTSAFEYVSRVSYAVLNTIPDNQLIQMAEDGTADSNPQAVIDYVLDTLSEQSHNGMRELFEGWFQFEHYFDEIARYFRYYHEWPELLAVDYGLGHQPLIPNPYNDNERFNLLGSYQSAAHDEILDLGAYLMLDLNAPVADLFTTRLAPVQDQTLMRAYNMSSAWDGNVNNMPMVGPERAGVLARAAMHFSSGLRTRPIIKGKRIRADLLCDTTGLPADNSTPDQVDTGAFEYVLGSTQHRTIALTQQPGTTCLNCHESLLNPLGFALEEFDPLGRQRSFEYVHQSFGGNDYVEQRSFNTTVVPRVNRTDTTSVVGTQGLSQLIAQSDEMHACFARNMVRHVFDRIESDAFDGCLLNQVFEDSRQLSMREVLNRLLLSPQMRLRRLDQLPNQ